MSSLTTAPPPTGRSGAAPPRAFGLDVLRILAAFGVLVTHVAFATGVVNPERWSSPLRQLLPRLDVGVSIFFVLSGLLVTRPYLRRVLSGDVLPEFGPYARRRLSRVFPLYWMVLAVTLLTAVGARPTVGRLLADVFLVHIYVPAWAIGPITQSWSLSTELAFYAFVPLWFAGCRRWFVARGITEQAPKVRWLAAGLVGWAVVALVWRLGVVSGTDTFDFTVRGTVDTRGALLTWLPNHLDTFAVGSAFALWLEAGRARPLPLVGRLASYAIGLGALWVAASALGLPPVFTGFDGPQTLGRHALFVLCAGALVLPSVGALARRPVGSVASVASIGSAASGEPGGRRHAPPALVRAATGAALGSYGIYLWHQWVTTHWFQWRALREFAAPFPTTLAAVVVLSSLLAAVTYWFVERPASALVTGRGGGRPAEPPRPLGRHPELDGLRGLSILAVLATHVIFLNDGNLDWSLPGGFLGVDVFLALSGFLIGAVLLKGVDRTGTVDGADFARRRARRLYPPLVVFLAVQGVVAIILGSAIGEQVLQAVLALTFTSNWQLSFGHQPPFDLVHLWSLSLEGQFYVLMAVGIWAFRRHLRRADRVVAALTLAAVVVALWRLYLYRIGVSLPALYERTGARADSMFLGVAAAMVWRSRLVSDRVLRLVGAAGLAGLAVATVVAEPGAPWLFQGGFTLIAACAAASVAAAATGVGAVARIGGVRALRWVGGISFSLYLWHLPIYIWTNRAVPDAPLGVKALIAVSASFAAGYLSFRLVESRVLPAWRTRADGLASGSDPGTGPVGAPGRVD